MRCYSSIDAPARRLSLTVYSPYHLNDLELREVAERLRVSSRALHNSLIHFKAYENEKPIHFHLMSRDHIPSVTERYHVGLTILPYEVMDGSEEGRFVNEFYADLLRVNVKAVMGGQPCHNPTKSTIVETAYSRMWKTVRSVEAYHQGRMYQGTERKATLRIHCLPHVCIALYESIYAV